MIQLSSFALGFWRLKHWNVSEQSLLKYIEQHLERGVTTMDHAMVYQSEAPFGRALALKPSIRDKMQLVTKCGICLPGRGSLGAQSTNHYDSSPEMIVASVNASLSDLKTDRIDLLLLHRPDYLMNPAVVAETFRTLKQSGKVLHFGVSNFSVSQFELLQQACDEPLQTNQIELSPIQMQALDDGTLDQCTQRGISPMLWSSLGGGEVLTPKSERAQSVFSVLTKIAENYNAEPVDIAYAWLRKLPCRPCILFGSQSFERNERALESQHITLTHEQWYAVWEASNGASVP